MSSVLTNIRDLFDPPDPRSEHEIDDDLDAEFAFHIEQLEAELIEQGVPPEHSSELARARFGNQEKLKRRCKAIAMKERIMLQRINTVLMVIVMLAVVGVSIQVYVTQRHNTLALLDITSQIATMRIEADAEARQAAAAEPARDRVLVEGLVERAGWYPIETNEGATYLHEIVQQAGGVRADYIVELRRTGQRINPNYRADTLLGDSPQRIVLRPGDEIRVVESDENIYRPGSAQVTSEIPSGIWRQVDIDGQIVDSGYTMTVLGSDDVRNLQGMPLGSLALDDHGLNLSLGFQSFATRSVPGGAPVAGPRFRNQNLHISDGRENVYWQGR